MPSAAVTNVPRHRSPSACLQSGISSLGSDRSGFLFVGGVIVDKLKQSTWLPFFSAGKPMQRPRKTTRGHVRGRGGRSAREEGLHPHNRFPMSLSESAWHSCGGHDSENCEGMAFHGCHRHPCVGVGYFQEKWACLAHRALGLIPSAKNVNRSSIKCKPVC